MACKKVGVQVASKNGNCPSYAGFKGWHTYLRAWRVGDCRATAADLEIARIAILEAEGAETAACGGGIGALHCPEALLAGGD